jgi:L-lactate utilization protein LutC
MTNPVLENIRRALGRPAQSHVRLRPDIYEPRLPESVDSEITRFLDEIKKLSGVGQKISQPDIDSALKTLVTEQNIRKVTVWNTPHLNQLQITNCLSSLGVELVSPNANKHEMSFCDLGITEADYLLPETGTLVVIATRSSRDCSL